MATTPVGSAISSHVVVASSFLLCTAKMKSLVSLPLVGWEALQLYTPASVKTRSLNTKTEVIEEVPLVDCVILTLLSRGELSLNQNMSGSGIPVAEQVKDAVPVMLTVVSKGNSVRVGFSVKTGILHVACWLCRALAVQSYLDSL